jgi:hypothetical protein
MILVDPLPLLMFHQMKVWGAKNLQFGPGEDRLIVDVPVHTRDMHNNPPAHGQYIR